MGANNRNFSPALRFKIWRLPEYKTVPSSTPSLSYSQTLNSYSLCLVLEYKTVLE